MNVTVDELSGSASVLDGSGGRCTGDGVFPSGRSGCPPQAVLNVHTLEMANGSDYCRHLLGLELTCNGCTLVSSARSATMRRGAPSASSSTSDIAADACEDPNNEIIIHFPPINHQRLIFGPTHDAETWFLLTPEDDKGWNQWVICYNDRDDEADPDIWIAYWFVWWWGKYIARPGEEYSDWEPAR